MEKERLIREVNKSLHEILQMNRGRCQSIEFAMNENAAVIFLGIGIHYDHAAKQAFPIIAGSQWISRQEAIKLLQDAIAALNTQLIEDAEKKILTSPSPPGDNDGFTG